MRGSIAYGLGGLTIVIDIYLILWMLNAWDRFHHEMQIFIFFSIVLWMFIGLTLVSLAHDLGEEHTKRKD